MVKVNGKGNVRSSSPKSTFGVGSQRKEKEGIGILSILIRLRV